MALDPRLILAQRPLATIAEQNDLRRRREIDQQEVELRRQDIDVRRQALMEAQARRNQPAEMDPQKQGQMLDYQLKLGDAVAARFQQAIQNPDAWPAVRASIGQLAGPQALQSLPEQWDEQTAAFVGQQVAAWPTHKAEVKATLQKVTNYDPETETTYDEFVDPNAVAGQRFLHPPAKTAAEKVPTPGSFEEYLSATPERKKEILEGRKVYNQADDRAPRVTVNAPAASGQGGYTPEGIDYAATRARVTGQYPGRNAQINTQIDNKIAEQNKLLGQSAAASVQRQAAYKGDASALADITKRAASAEAFEAKALGQIPIIQDISSKVPRTSWPIINAALQSGRTQITGDTNATQLANAIETFTEEYAKIMGGATGSAAGATDSSRAAAKRLLNTAMSKGTLNDVLALMQREMSLTMQGYDATKQHITERMGGVPGASPAAGVERWERGADGKLRKVGP